MLQRSRREKNRNSQRALRETKKLKNKGEKYLKRLRNGEARCHQLFLEIVSKGHFYLNEFGTSHAELEKLRSQAA